MFSLRKKKYLSIDLENSTLAGALFLNEIVQHTLCPNLNSFLEAFK